MLTNLSRKTLTFTAAFLDFSFLFQLLFVPVAFLLSTRSAQAITTPALEISYNAESSEFNFLAQPVQSIEYQVVYQPQNTDVEYEFGGTREADEQGRVEFSQAAESQSGDDIITYQVERGYISVKSILDNGTQQDFSSSFRIHDGELEFLNSPQQPSGYWSQVSVDTPYVSPENELVSVTFTSLPSKAGDLRIEEVELSDEQATELGAANTTAYEITSSMENGSFTYDLTLPNPTNSSDVQVQYSEDGEDFAIADPTELTVEKKQEHSVVTVKGLDHFTVFVVTGVDNSGSCSGAAISVSGGDTCYTNLQAAIDAAASGDTIDIQQALTTTAAVNITKALTINGNGHTISPTFTGPGSGNSNNAVLRITSQNDITINDLIIAGAGGTTLHGVNVFGSSNIVLNNITSKDNDRSGIAVNGSSVTVNNVTTSGNGWHGMNVDRGSGLPNAGVLTVTGVSKQSDSAHIYIDNTANGSVIDTENQYTSAHINLAGTHPNDLLYTLIGPVKNIDTGETFQTIKAAIQDSDTANGHTIEVKGSITVTENTTVNKDLTLRGVNSGTINTSGTNQLFTITSNGVTLENFAFVKTDNAGAQNLIGIQADDVTVQNNSFTGQFVPPGTGATSRALVTSSGAENLLITGNSFTNLRQPAYLNNGSAGTISNNFVTNTRGWVVEKNSNFTFSGNTWGTNTDGSKPLDIAIIAGSTPESTPNNYTCILPSIIANNNTAAVEDQYPGACPDTIKPTITYVSPAVENEVLTATDTIKVVFTDETALKQTTVHGYLNGTTAVPQIWVHPFVSGTEHTIELPLTGLADGTYQIRAAVTDQADNRTQINRNFIIDNTKPIITIKTGTGVNDGTIGKDGVYSRISFKLNDPNGGLASVVLNGNSYTRTGVWNDLNWQNITKSHLIEGENTIYAVDRAGNQSAPLTFIYDKTGPTITVKPAPFTNGSGSTFSKVGFSLFDGYKVDKLTLNGVPKELTDNKWSDLNDVGVHNWFGEVEGLNTLVVYDIAGNSTTYTFTLDRTAPNAPEILGFINPNLVCGAVTGSSYITVDWTDSTDSGSGSVVYEYSIEYPLIGGGRGQWGTTLAGSQYSGGLNPGLHTIKVRAKDSLGNVSAWSNSCDITLDTEAPAAPTNGQPHNTTLQSNDFWFTWDAVTDVSTPATYEFQSSMNPAESGGVLTTGLWKSGVLPGPTIHSTGAPDGTWYWQVRAIDASGNIGPWSEIWNVTLDTQERPPEASPSPTPSPSPIPSPEPTPEPSPTPEVSPSPEPQVLGDSSSSGSGGSTSARSAKPPVCSNAVPGTITNLTISSTASGATLSWTKPAGELTHYALEFVRLDVSGNVTGRYGVATLGDSNTTSFTIDNLPGGSAYRFELFAVNGCAPGSRSVATSSLITAPGAPDLESGEVIITPNTGEAEVLGTSTDEEMIEEAAQNGQNTDAHESSFLGQVLGASTENCQATAWWWIFLPAFLAGMALIHVLLAGKLRALAAALLLLGTGFGLHETNCSPWIWIGLIGVITIGSILFSLGSAPKRATAAPFSSLKRATKMKRS